MKPVPHLLRPLWRLALRPVPWRAASREEQPARELQRAAGGPWGPPWDLAAPRRSPPPRQHPSCWQTRTGATDTNSTFESEIARRHLNQPEKSCDTACSRSLSRRSAASSSSRESQISSAESASCLSGAFLASDLFASRASGSASASSVAASTPASPSSCCCCTSQRATWCKSCPVCQRSVYPMYSHRGACTRTWQNCNPNAKRIPRCLRPRSEVQYGESDRSGHLRH